MATNRSNKIVLNGAIYRNVGQKFERAVYQVTRHEDEDGPYIIVVRDKLSHQVFMGGSVPTREPGNTYEPF